MELYDGVLNSNAAPYAKAAEIGDRLKQARLNKDLSQAEVAEMSGLERRVILNAEKGSVSLINLIAILEALGKASDLDSFLPKQPISPIQLMKLQGKNRKRASGEHAKKEVHNKNTKGDLGW